MCMHVTSNNAQVRMLQWLNVNVAIFSVCKISQMRVDIISKANEIMPENVHVAMLDYECNNA